MPIDTGVSVAAEKKVDFPTFAFPNKPICNTHKNVILLNPALIVEVLSPSTEAYDRGEKFAAYRELKSFREYLLVSQTQPLVEQYIKQADGSWKFLAIQGLEASVRLETINCTLELRDIYQGLSLAKSEGQRAES